MQGDKRTHAFNDIFGRPTAGPSTNPAPINHQQNQPYRPKQSNSLPLPQPPGPSNYNNQCNQYNIPSSTTGGGGRSSGNSYSDIEGFSSGPVSSSNSSRRSSYYHQDPPYNYPTSSQSQHQPLQSSASSSQQHHYNSPPPTAAAPRFADARYDDGNYQWTNNQSQASANRRYDSYQIGPILTSPSTTSTASFPPSTASSRYSNNSSHTNPSSLYTSYETDDTPSNLPYSSPNSNPTSNRSSAESSAYSTPPQLPEFDRTSIGLGADDFFDFESENGGNLNARRDSGGVASGNGRESNFRYSKGGESIREEVDGFEEYSNRTLTFKIKPR